MICPEVIPDIGTGGIFMKKKLIGLCVVAMLLLLFLCTCVSVGYSEDCISIAFFEKWEAAQIDKIVVKADGKEIVITDQDLVSKIAKETTVATYAMIGCPEDRQIDAYSGDKLVRTMKWSTCQSSVKVYRADLLHWVIIPEFSAEYGFVFLTDEVVEQINALLAVS